MSNSILSQAVVIVAICMGGAYYLNMRGDDLAARSDQNTANASETSPIELKSARVMPKSASVVSIPRRNGHFYTYGQVNRGSVEFLVDTGASVVALTQADARKSGIRLSELVYDRPVQTAGGKTYAAAVNLDNLAIGGIRVRNVRAVVMQDGLGQSLLGMSFLGQLQKVEATPNALTLRH